jgi:hypothetical protein
MRSALPQFSTVVAPLHDLLELEYTRAGSRRAKTAAAKIPLSEVGGLLCMLPPLEHARKGWKMQWC